MNNYIHSFIKKFDYYFRQKEILNIIHVHDQDDHERLDQVLFLEKKDSHVIGLYIRGMNPLISVNRIYDLDDFNLYASYERLVESKENIKLRIENIRLYFSSKYNELLGFYLSDNDESSSLFVLFLQDEMDVKKNESKSDASKILKSRYSTEGYIIYEKESQGDWEEIEMEY
ncbi:hypothetical protein QUF95_04850 [Paenibacillus silvae]|uniref:hypothetical protein n=1 Tax=Paenibacillus silvae TaxID=1325358 RepID=UPI0025A232D5|nr:hypothetical protein [Paenibacillus silvae]MDM5276693.1 hypothetical protein [Paenibacillus silvae]